MDANTAALALIQRWVGPDEKTSDMSAFYDALVRALKDAYAEGEDLGQDTEMKAGEGVEETR